MKAWILVFVFSGQPVASGPHELDVCLYMASQVSAGHCWNPASPSDRRYPARSTTKK